ncbi:MAG: aspartate racemase [Marinilabiliales bacterium]|nr:MAG: aspartate racemase [Marinilabiliales bacterium]
MKTIGIVGGMSWESTKVYYEIINEQVKQKLGGFHSCKCLIYSVDFAEIQKLQHEDKWEELDILMADAAKRLQIAGADFIVLATNTMHLCVEAIKEAVEIPILHIAQATSSAIINKNINTVALLGTKFTMEKDFYKSILTKNNIEVITPNEQERDIIHNIIFGELVQGIIKDESRNKFMAIISRLQLQGAEGVILGCTEIPLLISSDDVEIEVFNTTRIHAEKAVEMALKE